MTKTLGLSIIGLGLLAVGCGAEEGDRLLDDPSGALVETTPEQEPEFDFDRNASVEGSDAHEVDDLDDSIRVVARDGAISASFGRWSVDGAATEIVSSGNTRVFHTTTIRNDQDSAMVVLEIRNLMHPVFMEVGRTTHFVNGEMAESDESADTDVEPSVDMRGCVGDSEGDWIVDQEMDDVEVRVEENDENGRVLSIQTAWISAELLLDVQ